MKVKIIGKRKRLVKYRLDMPAIFIPPGTELDIHSACFDERLMVKVAEEAVVEAPIEPVEPQTQSQAAAPEAEAVKAPSGRQTRSRKVK